MGAINQVADAIKAHAVGTDWYAGLPGGLWPPGEVPTCAKDSGLYAEYSWVGFTPDHTFGEMNDNAWIQFQIWGEVAADVNDSLDGCRDLYGNGPGNPNIIGGFFQMDEIETVPAIPENRKDRLSLFTGICQFRLKYTKICP